MPNFHVVPYAAGRGAPLMLAALAGVIHDRQRANGHEHDRDEDNYQGGFHCDLAVPRAAGRISTFQTEPMVNEPQTTEPVLQGCPPLSW